MTNPVVNAFIYTYEVGGAERIVSWSMDTTEAFCKVSRLVVAVPLNRTHCNVHDLDADDCPLGYRTPPECQHDPARLDPGALPEVPRCLECGAEGQDVTNDLAWRRRTSAAMQQRAADPSETDDGADILLGSVVESDLSEPDFA